MHDVIQAGGIRGRIRPCRVLPAPGGAGHLRVPLTDWVPNTVLYEWATIVGVLLTQGTTNYKIAGMYLEFENLSDPDDTIAAPDFERGPDTGVAYYSGLSSDAARDYLRVAITAATLSSSDETNFPGGNVCTFFAMSQGAEGVHGKEFSNAANSKLFGGALVAMVDEDDASQDLVLSRAYLSGANQQLKLDTSQLGLEWDITLG